MLYRDQATFLRVLLAWLSLCTTPSKLVIHSVDIEYNLSFFCSWYTIKHPFDWSKVPKIFLSKILQIEEKVHL